MAKENGVNPGKMKKLDIIRAIQVKENNYPCFGTANDYCDQDKCSWHRDCVSPSK